VLASAAAGALLLVLTGCGTTLDESLTDLDVGECVKDPGQTGEVLELERVDCNAGNVLEVIDKFDVTEHEGFPGDSALDAIAADGCPGATTTWLQPTRESWEGADDRLVICFRRN
jgi:hypothetical protein